MTQYKVKVKVKMPETIELMISTVSIEDAIRHATKEAAGFAALSDLMEVEVISVEEMLSTSDWDWMPGAVITKTIKEENEKPVPPKGRFIKEGDLKKGRDLL